MVTERDRQNQRRQRHDTKGETDSSETERLTHTHKDRSDILKRKRESGRDKLKRD